MHYEVNGVNFDFMFT